MSAPDTSRKTLDFGGIGPSDGGGSADVPLPPTDALQLSTGSTTTLATDDWDIEGQGPTNDGGEMYVCTRFAHEEVTSGVVRVHKIGRKLTWNAEGRVTNVSEEKLMGTEQQTGTASGGFGLW